MMREPGAHRKLWRWINDKPLGASLVAGLVVLAVPTLLAWTFSWHLWTLVKQAAIWLYDWLFIQSFSVTFPHFVWLLLGIASLSLLIRWALLAGAEEQGQSKHFFLTDYTEDRIGGIMWRWEWKKCYDNKWDIVGLTPCCDCEGPLVPPEVAAAMGRRLNGLWSEHSYLVCISVTCGKIVQTSFSRGMDFGTIKSVVDQEIRTRYRRKLKGTNT